MTMVAVVSELDVVTDWLPSERTVASPAGFDSGHGLGHVPRMRDVDVLIVGGGPVGLTASILLSRAGVTSLLVERHPGTAVHPKARGINSRTMEIFRQCGVEDRIRAAGLAPERSRFIVWSRSLAGEELERRVPARSRAEALTISPVPRCLCAQDDLEPVLRAAAESQQPGIVQFGAELLAFTQDADGVTGTIRTRDGESQVHARYLIAADGARSPVREALGIPMHGNAGIYRSINVLLNADLTRWVADRPAALYFIEQPGLKATFLTINGVNRWGFLINNLPVNGSGDEYTPERCAALVRQAAGAPDLEVEILGAVSWVAAALVAERYRRGRVFLAGDAAHHMPPTGGFGLNTGVQDVHNLAWKLAAVLHGWAGAGLLDSYEAERLPYGRAITEQALANARSLGRGETLDPAPAERTRAAGVPQRAGNDLRRTLRVGRRRRRRHAAAQGRQPRDRLHPHRAGRAAARPTCGWRVMAPGSPRSISSGGSNSRCWPVPRVARGVMLLAPPPIVCACRSMLS